MIEQFDEIYNSLINGNRWQAIGQAKKMGVKHFPDMLEYFQHDLSQPELAIKFCQIWFTYMADKK